MTLMLVDDHGLFRPTHKTTGKRLHAALAGGAFALAIGVKPIVLPLALPLAWRLRKNIDQLAIAITATLLTLAALYVPFMLMTGGISGMIETGRFFAENWSFNSSFYIPLKDLLVFPSIARSICAATLLAVMIAQIRMGRDLWVITITYLFLGLLLSSTCHPWYLLWALALLPVRPNTLVAPALWVWSLTITWSYTALLDPQNYTVPQAVMLLEYAPVYAALTFSIWRQRPDSHQRTSQPVPETRPAAST